MTQMRKILTRISQLQEWILVLCQLKIVLVTKILTMMDQMLENLKPKDHL